jgi:hypothetical protein
LGGFLGGDQVVIGALYFAPHPLPDLDAPLREALERTPFIRAIREDQMAEIEVTEAMLEAGHAEFVKGGYWRDWMPAAYRAMRRQAHEDSVLAAAADDPLPETRADPGEFRPKNPPFGTAEKPVEHSAKQAQATMLQPQSLDPIRAKALEMANLPGADAATIVERAKVYEAFLRGAS